MDKKESRIKRIPPREPILIRPTRPYRDFTKMHPPPLDVDTSKKLKLKIEALEDKRTEWFRTIYSKALTVLKFESLGDLIKWMVDNSDKLEFER